MTAWRPAGRLLVVAMAAACAAPPPVPTPSLLLRWRIEPDGGGGIVRLQADGSGDVESSPVEGAAAATAALGGDAARAGLVAAAPARLRGLPRWLHVSGTFAGARLAIERDGALVHDANHALAPPVAALLADLAATDAALAAALHPVLALPKDNGPRFQFSPRDDPARLLPVLVEGGGDVPLRHLAARIAIAENARSLCPALRVAFERSRAQDGEGDYFLASALLRLGDPVGLPRVARVLQASRPEWATEAADDLDACMPPGAFARPATPDDAAAAAAHLLAWFLANGARLHLPADARRYNHGDGGDAAR